MADETLPETPPETQPIPMLQCEGEGYITRADGTVVHFKISTEDK